MLLIDDVMTSGATLAALLLPFVVLIGAWTLWKLVYYGSPLPNTFEAKTDGGLTDEAVEDLLTKRREARAAKDFAEADRIRDELEENGIVIQDSPQGTTWHRG